ncbi:MAG: ZIP family metal transporter, partial [Patescibacteria group bacterium]
MSTLGFIVLASIFVSAIAFVGGLVLSKQRNQSAQLTSSLVSFAAGVMLTAALLDLLPEALEEAGKIVTYPVFFGVLLFFFFERFLLWFHHHHEPHGVAPTSLLVLIGDGLHNFIDGVAIASAFLVNPGIGFTTTLAIAAHEIPQEIADFSLLIHGGMKKTTALFLNFASGLTALIGAIAAYLYLEAFESGIPTILGFTAGMFLYIACSDLIPEMHKDFAKQKRWQQT